MQLIEARKLLVLAKRADNRLSVYLNGQQVHVVEGPQDPDLNVRIDFDVPYGLNSLTIIGENHGGPAHLAYRLLVDGQDKDEVTHKQPTHELGVRLLRTYLVVNPDHPPVNPQIS